MKVIVAEKPSVAAEIAKVVDAHDRKQGYITGNGYYVTWCVGHLVGQAQPQEYDPALEKWTLDTLPILPSSWKTSVLEATKTQYAIVAKLLNQKDVDEIICAGDCGREGELIFRLVYNHAGCRKPVKRLWVSSLVAAELQRGLAELQDGSAYDNLYMAALCRSRADWLVGINLTRLYSLIYNHKLTVGRVQAPTTALIVKRQKDIDTFVPTPYWHVSADMGEWKAYTTVNSADAAQNIVNRCIHKSAFVSKLTRENKTSNPPKLFSITTLQREANRLLGYTAQQTLNYAQSLYEKKITTYPRTECEFIPSNMLADLPDLLSSTLALSSVSEQLKVKYDLKSVSFDRIINDKKIEDHHAIIPTGADRPDLPTPERNILILIAYRFLATVAPSKAILAVTAILDIESEAFKATGHSVITAGYQTIIDDMMQVLKGVDNTNEENTDEVTPTNLIPTDLEEGQTLQPTGVVSVQKYDHKPCPYTDDSLLSDLQRLGLGTGATRAGMIETIIKNGYVQRDHKKLLPTDDGKKMVSVLDAAITQPELTARWEEQLEQVAAGTRKAEQFMSSIESYVGAIVNTAQEYGDIDTETFAAPRVSVGKCPRCGQAIFENKKTFQCERISCGFTLWKEDRFFVEKKKVLDVKAAALLLQKGSVKMTGLWSEKKQCTYDAIVTLQDTGKYVNYQLQFDQNNGQSKSGRKSEGKKR